MNGSGPKIQPWCTLNDIEDNIQRCFISISLVFNFRIFSPSLCPVSLYSRKDKAHCSNGSRLPVAQD